MGWARLLRKTHPKRSRVAEALTASNEGAQGIGSGMGQHEVVAGEWRRIGSSSYSLNL